MTGWRVFIYWINRAQGNYRCTLCGYQYHDAHPSAHIRERHIRAALAAAKTSLTSER